MVEAAQADVEKLLAQWSAWGRRTALLAGAESVSYAELAEETRKRAAQLAAQIKAGTVVALTGDFSRGNVATLFALALRKAVIVPIANPASADLAERLRVSAAQFVVEGGAAKLVLQPGPGGEPPPLVLEMRAAGQAGLILFSSGSTGQPKAMLHDFDRLLAGYPLRAARDLRLLLFLLFDHIGGMDCLLRGITSGTTFVIVSDRRPDEVSAAIALHEVEVLPASPTFLNLLLLAECHLRFDLRSLKTIGFGAEPMPEALLARLKAAFPQVLFQQKFGTSETNAIRVRNRADGSLFMAIDDPGVEWKVVDGELWLRSRARIVGYLNAGMARFTEDGWFRTGDLVEEDGAGYFRVAGRLQEMINVGGEKVLPTEVEGVLMAHPAVRACVVRGEPHPLTGQQVRAEIMADPAAAADPAKLRSVLRQHCRERLAAYKVPSRIVLVDQLDAGERFKLRRLPQPSTATPSPDA